MTILPAYVFLCMCVTHKCSAHKGQKKASELQLIVSCHTGVGNLSQVLWKGS